MAGWKSFPEEMVKVVERINSRAVWSSMGLYVLLFGSVPGLLVGFYAGPILGLLVGLLIGLAALVMIDNLKLEFLPIAKLISRRWPPLLAGLFFGILIGLFLVHAHFS